MGSGLWERAGHGEVLLGFSRSGGFPAEVIAMVSSDGAKRLRPLPPLSELRGTP